MKKVNQARVIALLEGLARFGSVPGQGITRLGYSPLDREAQDWLLEQVKDLNLEITEDAVGNLHLLRPGRNRQLPPAAAGSHLDTVFHGGAYDGAYGVVGALESLYMLQDESLERSIEIVVFRAEESSRFGFATIGSKLLTGKATPNKLSKSTRKGDISLIEAMKEWGCDPAKYQDAVLPPGAYKCFCELHIEQGKVLEETHTKLGVVRHIAAPTRFKIHLKGMADHSGATPMGMRHDALVTAAKIILAVEQAATAEKEYGSVATVGVVEVDPGSINVVPGAVTLWVDVRGVVPGSIERTLKAIKKNAEEIAAADAIGVSLEMMTADQPVIMSKELAEKSAAICRAKGFSYRAMPSGAGHDVMHMAAICPSTMLFIPCRGGISHNPAEFAEPEDMFRGIEVFAEILKGEALE